MLVKKELIEEIKEAITKAAKKRKFVAALHYQILINADELKDVNTKQLCKDIGIHESYTVECNKMFNLAKLMKEEGITIAKKNS